MTPVKLECNRFEETWRNTQRPLSVPQHSVFLAVKVKVTYLKLYEIYISIQLWQQDVLRG